MARKIKLVFFIIIVIVGGIWLYVIRAPLSEPTNGRIKVVASFYPLAHIASVVGGEFVSVRTLVPAGTETHDFEPSSRDLIEIGGAEAFIYNGAEFEPWIRKWNLSGFSRDVLVVDIARKLEEKDVVLQYRHNILDPHFWLDPSVFIKEIEIIRDTLAGLDPIHRDLFFERAERFTREINLLDIRFQNELSSCEVRDVVVSHDAFGYLASRYKFFLTPIAGISPDEEPAPKDLARIVKIVREKGVKYIFSETVASPKFSEAMAREIGGSILVLDPLEGLIPSDVQSGEDYISKMEMNLTNLKIAMSCQ